MEATGTSARASGASAAPPMRQGTPGTIDVLDDAAIDMATHRWGVIDPRYGEAAVRWTKEAGGWRSPARSTPWCRRRSTRRRCTRPGYAYEGQTEILGELTGSKPAMVMVVDRMRLMLFTNHMALRAVCDYLRTDRVLDRLVLARRRAARHGHRRAADRGRRRSTRTRARTAPSGARSSTRSCPADRGGAGAWHRRAGAVPRRHRLPQVTRRRLRHDARALPRSGPDGGEAGRLRPRGDAADRPAAHPHVDRATARPSTSPARTSPTT